MKESGHGGKEALVRRIAVDEKLDEGLMRLLIAPLAEGVEVITDSLADWGEEKEAPATPDDCLRLLGLEGRRDLASRVVADLTGTSGDVPPDEKGRRGRTRVAELLWRVLAEGQVYLVGGFTVEGARHDPEAIRRSADAYDFLRIDRLPSVKKELSRLYSEALRGRRSADA